MDLDDYQVDALGGSAATFVMAIFFFACGAWAFGHAPLVFLLTIALVVSAAVHEWYAEVYSRAISVRNLLARAPFRHLPESLKRRCTTESFEQRARDCWELRMLWVVLALVPLTYYSGWMAITGIMMVCFAGTVGQELGLRSQFYGAGQARLAPEPVRPWQELAAEDDARCDSLWADLECSRADADGYVSYDSVARELMRIKPSYAKKLIDPRYAGRVRQLSEGLDIEGDPDQPESLRIHVTSLEDFLRRYRRARDDQSLYPGYGYDPDFIAEIDASKGLWMYW